MPAADTAGTADIAGLRRILREHRRIAVVGLSADWHRPSFFAAKYMQAHGYDIIPVNPKHAEILGVKSYPGLEGIPGEVGIRPWRFAQKCCGCNSASSAGKPRASRETAASKW